MKVFTVYDSKAEAYLTPFYMKTKGEALRAFTDTAQDPNSNICKHSADYTLFELGEYDEQKGSFSIHNAKINLGVAQEFKNQ